jgi:hypothetical protein
VVTINNRVKTFADISGILSLSRGGTGASDAETAKRNLGLSSVATSGSYLDLSSRPQFVSYISNVGEGSGGIPLIQSIIQTIASIRTLKSDGSVSIFRDPANDDHIVFGIGAVPAERIDGILSPAHGGTGLGQEELDAGEEGQVPTLTGEKTFELRAVPKSGHDIWNDAQPLPFQPNLVFRGAGVRSYNNPDDGSTVVEVAGDASGGGWVVTKYFTADQFDLSGNYTIGQSALPFTIENPLIVLRDREGRQASADVEIINGERIRIHSGLPFSGSISICGWGAVFNDYYATRAFTEAQWDGTRLTLDAGLFQFPIDDAFLQVQDSSGHIVDVGAQYFDSPERIVLEGVPFSGSATLFHGMGDEFIGKYASIPFTAGDFQNGSLRFSEDELPFSIVNPFIALFSDSGKYVDATIVVRNGESIVISAEPFGGRMLYFSGEDFVEQVGHIIVGPDGTLYPTRRFLQFAGDGIASISDDQVNNRTRIVINGGGGGTSSFLKTFNVSDWTGSGEFQLSIPAGAMPFSGSIRLVVEVQDVAGNYILLPHRIESSGDISLFSWEKFAGKAIITP